MQSHAIYSFTLNLHTMQTDQIDTNKAVPNQTTVRLSNGSYAIYTGNYIWDRDNDDTARVVMLRIGDGKPQPTSNYDFKEVVY